MFSAGNLYLLGSLFWVSRNASTLTLDSHMNGRGFDIKYLDPPEQVANRAEASRYIANISFSGLTLVFAVGRKFFFSCCSAKIKPIRNRLAFRSTICSSSLDGA